MVKIDWNAFRHKNPDSRTAFEQLCYAIVCRKYNQKFGVLRYFNQKHIETDPIICEGEAIGFQAKFWPDVVLSSRKGEIANIIRDALECYKDLTRYIFFCPDELVSDKTDGPCKCSWWDKIVDESWEKYKVHVEFFGTSEFEGTMVQSDNDDLGRFYFSLDQNEYHVFESLLNMSQLWLANTSEALRFNDKEIRIPRVVEMETLDNFGCRNIVIVSGPSGCGKSGMIKRWIDSHRSDNRFTIVMKADELLDELSSKHLEARNTAFGKIVGEIKLTKSPLFVFDSAERIFERRNENALIAIAKGLASVGVQLIFTVRDEFARNLKALIKRVPDGMYRELQIKRLSDSELRDCAKRNGFELPMFTRIGNLLRNLFYLQQYLDQGGNAAARNVHEFKRELWHKHIQDNGRAPIAGRVLVELVKRKVEEGTIRLRPRIEESDAVETLCRLQIITQDPGDGLNFSAKHDAYEDWALEHYIDEIYAERGFLLVAKELSQSYPMRRAFRNWLSEACAEDGGLLDDMVDYVLADNLDDRSDEVLIALIIAGKINNYFAAAEAVGLSMRDVLLRAVRLAVTRCTVDHMLLLSEQEKSCQPESFQVEPVGEGWECLIEKIIALIEDDLTEQDRGLLIKALRIWAHSSSNCQLLGAVGQSVLSLIRKFQTGRIAFPGRYYEDLADVVVSSSEMIRDELGKMIAQHLKRFRKDSKELVVTDEFLMRFCNEVILDACHCAKFIVACPELACQIFYTYCFVPKVRTSKYVPEPGDSETYMSLLGIRDQYQKTFSRVSAYEGPFYWIISGFLRAQGNRWLRGYRLLMMTINGLSSRMQNLFSDCFETKEIWLGQFKLQVVFSGALWSYRHKTGNVDLPPIYRSLVCSFERCVYEAVQKCKGESDAIDAFLTDLGRRATTASILSALLTVSLFDRKCNFHFVAALAKDPEIVKVDWMRRQLDQELVNMPCPSAITSIYKFEQSRFAKESARRWAIGDILRMIQLDGEVGDGESGARASEINKILDGYFEHIEEFSPELQHVIYCADVRHAKKRILHTANGDQTLLDGVDLPPHLQGRVDEAAKGIAVFSAVSAIMKWLHVESMDAFDSPYYGYYDNKAELLIEQFKLIDEDSGALSERSKDECLFAISPIVYLQGHTTLPESTKQKCLSYFDRGLECFRTGNQYQQTFRCVLAIPGICTVCGEALQNKYLQVLSSLLNNDDRRAYGRACDIAAEAVRKMYLVSPALWTRIFESYGTQGEMSTDFDHGCLRLSMLAEELPNALKVKHMWESIKTVIPVCVKAPVENSGHLLGTVELHCYFVHLFRLIFSVPKEDFVALLDYLWSQMRGGHAEFFLSYLRDALTRKGQVAQFWSAWQHSFALFEKDIVFEGDLSETLERVLMRFLFGDIRIIPEPVLQSSLHMEGKYYFKRVYSSDAVLSKPTGVLVLTGALGQSNIPNFKEGVVSLLERYKRVADIKASRVTAREFQYVFERLLEKVFREYAPLFASDGRFKTSVCELMDIWADKGSSVAAQLRDQYA